MIDGWLEADRSAPRKQRHTGRRVWERLVEEHGIDIGECTVRRYVGQARQRHELAPSRVFVPQHHPLGEKPYVAFHIGLDLCGVREYAAPSPARRRSRWLDGCDRLTDAA